MVGDSRDHPSCERCHGNPGIGIVEVDGAWDACLGCGAPALWTRQIRFHERFPDLPAAKAEFERRELELLSQEATS